MDVHLTYQLKKGDNKKPVRNDENVQFVQPGEEKIKKGTTRFVRKRSSFS
jgi:hypothetical protein